MEDLIFEDIIEVNELNSDDYVYDIELEKNHLFLCNNIINHNCRLSSQPEMLKLANQVNSFGGSAISLGSHRVVTINMNRIALEATSIDDFNKLLITRTLDAIKILIAHKELLKDVNKINPDPFIKLGWIALNKMFSTIGIIGYYEMNKNLQEKFNSNEDFIKSALIKIDELSKSEGVRLNTAINVEQIPGESIAVKLATIDKLLFPDNVNQELYANQYVPLWENISIWDRMDISGKYDKLTSGGGICHFSLGERISSETSEKLIEYAAKSGSEHFALNAVYSECLQGHNHFGNFKICPQCGSEIIEQYVRVVGFFVPVSSWNKTRREQDFPKRYFENIK